MSIEIKTFYDAETGTLTHVVHDKVTIKTAIIDSVLNYDQLSGVISTKLADEIIYYITENNLKVEWMLETHIHADHLTAASYLKEKLGGKTAIGTEIKEVLSYWATQLDIAKDTPLDGSQFDKLLSDNEIIMLGKAQIKVIFTPGHTPACVSYLIEDNIFVGDTIFMPDIGTARADFPGGDASNLYDSIKKILSLADNTKIFSCHDYPKEQRDICFSSTVKVQRQANILLNDSVSKEEYVSMRIKRDKGLPMPKLLLTALKINLKAGNLDKLKRKEYYY